MHYQYFYEYSTPQLKGEHGAAIASFLLENLEVLVDDSHGQQNARAGADSAQEVREDGQSTDAHTAETGGSGDVTVEFLLERFPVRAVALDDQSLFGQLLGHVVGRLARHLDPGLGEERARDQDESEVEAGV